MTACIKIFIKSRTKYCTAAIQMRQFLVSFFLFFNVLGHDFHDLKDKNSKKDRNRNVDTFSVTDRSLRF